MTELIGASLGQYHITEEVGKGGMAIVYRATQQSIGREVAIKVLPSKLTHEDTFLERFTREVEVVASLQHPHITPIYDYGEFEGQPYIVMAYYSGGTLGDVLGERCMELTEVIKAIRQASDALDYAHGKGVIHRDIKPSNFLMDEQRNIYLADFGLAKAMDAGADLTGSGLLGTPAFMAPELSLKGGLTALIDVYALGVMLFQMLTGRPPFEADTALGVILAHANNPIPDILEFRDDLPEDLQDVIYTAMAKRPDERYKSPNALATALESAATTTRSAVETSAGLLFTNIQGQIIFVDSQLLKMTGRNASAARVVIGQSMQNFLSIPESDVHRMIAEVQKIGQIHGQVFDITDSSGELVTIVCGGIGSYDDKGTCLGVDFSIRYASEADYTIRDSPTPISLFDTSDKLYLEVYFSALIVALRTLLMRAGGKRLANNMERLVNETAQRNEWSIEMHESNVNINLKDLKSDVYRALLSRAVAYATDVVGNKLVAKQMKAVEDQLGDQATEMAEQLGLRNIFEKG